MKQRRAGQNDRHLVHLVNGQNRSTGDHDAGHPLAQQPGAGRALAGPGAGQQVIGDSPHGQHAAHAQAQHGRPALVDRDLTRAIRRRQPPGEHLRDLDKPPEPPIDGRQGVQTPRAHRTMADRLQAQPSHWCHCAGAGQPAERIEVPAQPGKVWPNEHIRSLGGRQETRVGALCPPRPRGGGQHSTPGDGHQQHQHRPAPPPGTQLIGGEISDCPHPITPTRAPAPRRPPWVRG